MGRVFINEPLESDFTLDKIRYADAYNKVQYWDILRHNRMVDVAESKFSKFMDAFLTGITVSTSLISLSPTLGRMGFKLLKTADSAISKVRVNMLRYRLHKMRNKVMPRNEFEIKTFKEYKGTFSKKAKPLPSDVPPLEQRLIQTQHKTVNVRINRRRKIVNRVRYNGKDSDPPPALKDIKKLRKVNKGKVNVGPARGLQTPIKLKSFNELRVRMPGKNYSLINRGPELNIPPRAPFCQKVIKQRVWITELKRKYGLRRKHFLPSRLSVSGLARVTFRIRQPVDPISSTPSDSLARDTRPGSGNVEPPSGGLGRDVTKDSDQAAKSIGGIILPSTRRRKNRRNRRGFFRR